MPVHIVKCDDNISPSDAVKFGSDCPIDEAAIGQEKRRRFVWPSLDAFPPLPSCKSYLIRLSDRLIISPLYLRRLETRSALAIAVELVAFSPRLIKHIERLSSC